MPSKAVHAGNELLALFFYGVFYALHAPFLLLAGLVRGRRGPWTAAVTAALLILHAYLVHVTPLWEVEAALGRVYAATFAEMSSKEPGQTNQDRWLAFREGLDRNSRKHGFDSWMDLNARACDLLGRNAYERAMERLSVHASP